MKEGEREHRPPSLFLFFFFLRALFLFWRSSPLSEHLEQSHHFVLNQLSGISLYLVCLTDIRQSLATPLTTSGKEKPPSLSDLLSTMNNSLTNQLKLILNSLKVSVVTHRIMTQFLCVTFCFMISEFVLLHN